MKMLYVMTIREKEMWMRRRETRVKGEERENDKDALKTHLMANSS